MGNKSAPLFTGINCSISTEVCRRLAPSLHHGEAVFVGHGGITITMIVSIVQVVQQILRTMGPGGSCLHNFGFSTA